ncbi:FAD-dependent oxidoreductase [Lachnospiraceae bacterium OttesenSCG-928-E19]|nr:FAD-dependent oxidoreductase [Lachnospiraceae bacterium OttesenSCG-928-E19]
MIYDFLIIGGGITGITLSKKLKEKGKSVLVLEAKEEAGGLCRTQNVNGHEFDIGGGHFFHTKHQEIFDLVFKYMPESEFNFIPRVSKLKMGETTIDYPLESNLWQLPLDEQIEFLISVIRNGESLGKAEPKNYEEWIRWKLGNKICDTYMIPYNTKLWGVAPSEMDVDWLYKIPRVNVQEVLKYSLERKQDVNKFPAHISFYYPKVGGFQKIVDALFEDEKENTLLNTKVVKLTQNQDNIWVINDEFMAKNVINTTPWNDLYEALGAPMELKSDFEKIQYNKLVVSLYEKDFDVDWHWRYVPDMDKDYHREFYIPNFAKSSKKNGMYVETNVKRFKGDEPSVGSKALMHYETDAAYPIPVIGHADAIKNILDYYKPKNLFGVGRWGQHQYQNADVSMFEALKFVEGI